MIYEEKSNDPRWIKKQYEIMERDGEICSSCGTGGEYPVHIYHRYKTEGKEPWDYPDDCFFLLCDGCHECLKEEEAICNQVR